MSLNWVNNDYFAMLLYKDKRAYTALEMLVDDLHADKERSISRFLCHSGSEDFLWGLVKLLGNSNSRVAGNAAYIIGTLAESELGCYRVISLTEGKQLESKCILQDLTHMLTFDDAESVMNAAGTMGTLAESHEGRAWMLREPHLDNTIKCITKLLNNDNMWTASNAALVLARLTISEEGCEKLLNHEDSHHILSQLISSLGVDEAGRGMNAAFAIGRLCDMEPGRTRLLGLQESERMITSLAKMLCCNDTGASKNACFALSCLATNRDGHSRLLNNSHSEEVLRTLTELLSADDGETGWFAAMTLRTLASQPKGCLRLRDHPQVVPALKTVEDRSEVGDDLREEALLTLSILKRLEKPAPPIVEVVGGDQVEISWPETTTKSGFEVFYYLYDGQKAVYSGKNLSYLMNDLQPFTQYNFRLRVHTEGDDSPFSDTTTITTDETAPGPVQNLRILALTTTQIKVGWDPPTNPNGTLRGYYVFNGKGLSEHTTELTSIISGLQPSTTYEIQVCAATSKGKGPRETIVGTTTELGAHAPSKPEILVRGRNELHVSWRPPVVPLGRITRYDLHMNGRVVYSGTELTHNVVRLTPNTEYTFTVSAITNEGRCESKPAKKKTAKDEYDVDRAPLYQPPPRKEMELEPKPEQHKPPVSVKRKKSLPTSSLHEMTSVKTTSRTSSAATTSSKGQKETKTLSSESTSVHSSRPVSAKVEKREKEDESTKSPELVPERATTNLSKKSLKKKAPDFHRARTSIIGMQQDESLADSQPTRSAGTNHRSRAGFQGSSPKHGDSNFTKVDRHKRESKQKQQESLRTQSQSSSGNTSSNHGNREAMPFGNTPDSGFDSSLQNGRTLISDTSEQDADWHKILRTMRPGTTADSGDPQSSQGLISVEIDQRKGNLKLDAWDPRSSLLQDTRLKSKSTEKLTSNKGERKNSDRSDRSHRSSNERSEIRTSERRRPPSPITPGSQNTLDVTVRQIAARREATEADPGWLSHSQRYDNLDITRTFSTLQMTYSPPKSPKLRSGLVELEAPVSVHSAHTSSLSKKTQHVPSQDFLTRTNTFINSHRPTRRPLEKLTPKQMQQAHQAGCPAMWKPDFPGAQKEKNHNKFIPMQFRTQPLNMPGVRRETTSVMPGERGGRRLEALGLPVRSHTEFNFKGQGSMMVQAEETDLTGFTLTSQPISRDRFPSATSNSTVTSASSAKKPQRASPRGTAAPPGGPMLTETFAINHPSASTENKLQSAR